MNGNTIATALAVVATLGLALTLSLSGGVGAEVVTNESNFTAVGNETVVNTTVDTDAGTRSLTVTVNNSTGNVSPVEVGVFNETDVDAGNGTEVDRVQVRAPNGSTETYEFSNVSENGGNETYRVVVEGDGNDTDAVTVTAVEEVDGGGGGGGGGGGDGGGGGAGDGGFLDLGGTSPVLAVGLLAVVSVVLVVAGYAVTEVLEA